MASVPDAVRRSCNSWAHEVHGGSLVFLDAGAAEAVAAGIGLAALHERLGVAAVFDLAAASAADLGTAALLSGGAPVRRAVFLLTTVLADAEAAVLAACRACLAAAQFTVLCSVSEAAHHDEWPGLFGPGCFAALAAAWQQQLNEQRRAAGGGPCSVAIQPLPPLLCPLSGGAFVLPAGSAAAALPRAGQLAAGYGISAAAAAGEDSDDEHAPGGAAAAGGPASSASAAGLSLLAHTLVGAMAVLGHRPEAFSVGPCSQAVCRAMAFVPTAAGDAPPAALVLVDRVLDLASPAVHADLLVQRMFDLLQQPTDGGLLLPPPPQQQRAAWQAAASPAGGLCFGRPDGELPMPCLDPQPPATPLESGTSSGSGASGAPAVAPAAAAAGGPQAAASADGSSAAEEPSSLLPGSLRHPDDAEAERWLEFLLSRKGRDAQMFVRKWLREAARKEGVPQLQRFKPGSITAAELRSLAASLRRHSPAAAYRHAALLQLAEAAAAALEGPHADHWEALQREERQLLFACTESAEAAAAHLLELSQLAGKPGSPLALGDLVLLVLSAYCLLPDFLPWFASGPSGLQAFQPQQEQQLAGALVEAVMACSTTSCSTSSSGAAAPEPDSLTPSGSPAWPLEQLAARVAAAKQAAGAQAGGPAAAGQAATPGGGAAGVGSGSKAQQQQPAEDLQALRLEAQGAVDALLARMHELAGFRRSQLKHLGRLAGLGEDGTPRRTPLLRQIAEHILQDKPLPDLHAGATSLSGLLKSGLGRFGLQAAPKPSDCPTVVLFVVGGITLAELHEIMQAVDERAARSSGGGSSGSSSVPPAPRVIVGATALLCPRDLCGHLFAALPTAL